MTTRTQEWHADRALLSRYLAGALDAVTGASVEQHVSQCETCRAAVGRLLDPRLLERTWAGIRDGVERPTLPYPMRVARRLGLPEPTVVLLASAASLRGAWMVGAFLSLSFATLAAYASDGKALAPFLLAAPLAPVLGVAAAYGPRQDPLEALVATAPPTPLCQHRLRVADPHARGGGHPALRSRLGVRPGSPPRAAVAPVARRPDVRRGRRSGAAAPAHVRAGDGDGAVGRQPVRAGGGVDGRGRPGPARLAGVGAGDAAARGRAAQPEGQVRPGRPLGAREHRAALHPDRAQAGETSLSLPLFTS